MKQEVVLKFLDAQYCVTCDTNGNVQVIKQLFQVSGNINAELMNADEMSGSYSTSFLISCNIISGFDYGINGEKWGLIVLSRIIQGPGQQS